ncbi:hypothetical protein C5S35_14330 [Candidatus Methanophagaceae archaeon]|nr:hypothetical protein C5S35_14330 [Methanophagales archaeon]
MITAEEVVKSLPTLLKQHPMLRTEIFEIKSYAEEEDIERFNDKAELALKKLDLKNMKKVLITLEKRPLVVELCDKFGIQVG